MTIGQCSDQRAHTPMPVPHPHGPASAPPAPPLPADPLPPMQEPPSEQPAPISDPPPAPTQGSGKVSTMAQTSAVSISFGNA